MSKQGFTLIELSIVLVIIGLIIGGILVGRDLITAATIRATISQIEKYKTAVGTFRAKYGYLPGDLPASQASSLGFIARSGAFSHGDGNGNVQGIAGGSGLTSLGGETVFFWTDLSSAGLVDGSFTDSSDAVITIPGSSVSQFANYVPPAKIGNSTYVFAFDNPSSGLPKYTGVSFEITKPTNSNAAGDVSNKAGMSVQQAYSIDSKIDDGYAITGLVAIGYPAQGGGSVTSSIGYVAPPMFLGSTSNHCAFSTAPYAYNVVYGDNVNCSLILGGRF